MLTLAVIFFTYMSVSIVATMMLPYYEQVRDCDPLTTPALSPAAPRAPLLTAL